MQVYSARLQIVTKLNERFARRSFTKSVGVYASELWLFQQQWRGSSEWRMMKIKMPEVHAERDGKSRKRQKVSYLRLISVCQIAKFLFIFISHISYV